MDMSQIVKVAELTDSDYVNAYLKTGRWVLLNTAAGQNEEHRAYVIYALGWLGPDPACPNDKSEEPELPLYATDVEVWS